MWARWIASARVRDGHWYSVAGSIWSPTRTTLAWRQSARKGRRKSHPQAVRRASRAMLRLAQTLDKTLALVAWGNHGPTVIAWQAATTPVAADLPLGLVLPVTSSASGLALAAFLPPEAVDRFVTAELRDNARQASGEPPLTAES